MCVSKCIFIDTDFSRVVSAGNTIVNRIRFDFSHASSGEYVVDDSHFVPMSEAIHQLGVNASASNNAGLYDFPDGKDTGIPLPISRKKGVTLAEISMAINESNVKISDAAKAQETYSKKIQSFEQSLNSDSGGSEE